MYNNIFLYQILEYFTIYRKYKKQGLELLEQTFPQKNQNTKIMIIQITRIFTSLQKRLLVIISKYSE